MLLLLLFLVPPLPLLFLPPLLLLLLLAPSNANVLLAAPASSSRRSTHHSMPVWCGRRNGRLAAAKLAASSKLRSRCSRSIADASWGVKSHPALLSWSALAAALLELLLLLLPSLSPPGS
jgi:hypothetical protein